MLSYSTASTRRRILLLIAGCALPLFFIGATTSYFYPEYLPPTFKTKPVTTQEPIKEPADPWDLPAGTTAASHSSRPTTHPSHTKWTFDYLRDERNFGLSDEQCQAAFPDFYHEIDRAVKYREKVGQITRDDVDISWRQDEMIRAMIYDRQLYIVEAKWAGHGFDVPRALAILNAIYRSIVSYPGPIPNIEFSFCLGDVASWDGKDKHAIWALTRRAKDEEKWVMSDFGYWSWPLDVVGEYTQVRNEILELEKDMPFREKRQQAVWRGAVGTNPLRETMVNITRGKFWSDVHEIVWLNMTTMAPGMAELSLTMPEHCQYQYLLHTEGHSYSGRGKYLQNCASVVVMHKLEWIEPHTHLLIPSGPEQNIVQVERDFSDLEEKIEDLLAHPADAERIAVNGVRKFRERYLTPAAQACYWRRMFWGWKSVQGFEPELWEEVEEEDDLPTPEPVDAGMISNEELREEEEAAIENAKHGDKPTERKKRRVRTVKRMRGKPYETFILEGFKPVPE